MDNEIENVKKIINAGITKKTDMEVFMDKVPELFDKFVQINDQNNQISKQKIESDERVAILKIENQKTDTQNKHKENIYTFFILIIIGIIGGIGGIITISIGKIEWGIVIISSTVSGILGFFGGRSTIEKKQG